jgi:hypothetical protein
MRYHASEQIFQPEFLKRFEDFGEMMDIHKIFDLCDGVMITFNVLWICSLSWISHHYANQVML